MIRVVFGAVEEDEEDIELLGCVARFGTGTKPDIRALGKGSVQKYLLK